MNHSACEFLTCHTNGRDFIIVSFGAGLASIQAQSPSGRIDDEVGRCLRERLKMLNMMSCISEK